MGAWYSVGSRSDLRRRPRHRCAVATPVPVPAHPRQTSRRRSAGEPGDDVDDDASTTATAHLSLIACRGSVATSFRIRQAGTDRSSTPGTSRRRRRVVGHSAPWRQSSGVATLEQENTPRGSGALGRVGRSPDHYYLATWNLIVSKAAAINSELLRT